MLTEIEEGDRGPPELIDPRPPGSATSFGNAGAIVAGGVVPTATPGLWKRVPKMLLPTMTALLMC